ncbi:MAG: 16S rRNA (cytosine(1402)-N(4))-methyltransferase RsmH [Pyrinomonadaceae bacterium]
MSQIDAGQGHLPVLLDEVIRYLEPQTGLFVDATVGLGGHSAAILSSSPHTQVIGIDQDGEALLLAGQTLASFGDRALLVKGNFSDIPKIVTDAGRGKPRGIIADLGVSSLQLDSKIRGFSFRFDSPLDMRMDAESGRPTAAELLATLDQEDLANIIYEFGEDRFSRRIARRIIERREAREPILTTFDLAELIRRAVPRGAKEKIHPATRTFQALRIAVNGELDILDSFISDCVDLLAENARLVIITFHSLEDRVIKKAFQRLSGKCECPTRIPQCMCGAKKRIEVLTRRPVVPGETEKSENPRSRSAKLRACRKLDQSSH